MSKQLRLVTTVMSVLAIVVGAIGAPCFGQCEAPGENIKCWTNTTGNGSWNNILNWNPVGVPESTDHVYHLNGGTITYNVTNALNQTIASFTALGGATALTFGEEEQGLVLHISGDMVNSASGDYELSVSPRSQVTVGGSIRDVKVTLASGSDGDHETTMQVNNDVRGGDWTVPQYTHVTINGSVYATGQKRWDVGTQVGATHFAGGIVTILEDVHGGEWHLYGNLPDVAPLPEIAVNGTIYGGCWYPEGNACATGFGPKSRWRFHDISVEGPDPCDYANLTEVYVRDVGRYCIMAPAEGATIEGGRWYTDLSLGTGKITSVSGGHWAFVRASGPITIDDQTYVINVGTMELDEVTSGECTLATKQYCSLYFDGGLVLSGPGSSFIPTMYLFNGGLPCGLDFVNGTLETADAATHLDTLTMRRTILEGQGSNRVVRVNPTSAGATQTDLVIGESAILIGADVKAKSLTIHGPTEDDASTLEMHSPDRVPSVITLAGPADLGAVGQFELLYYNRDNTIGSRAPGGPLGLTAFTLGEKAVLRAGESKGAPNLNLIATGDVDVKTEFPNAWVNEGGLGDPRTVGQQWDTRTTNLTLLGLIGDVGGSLGLITTKLELFSADYGPNIFADTPCRGALGTLHIRTDNGAQVELVDAHTNQPPSVNETLYVKNIIIDPNASLEVHSFVIYYTNQMSILGQVTREGVVLNPHEHENIFIRADELKYGDFNFDGDVNEKDQPTFCEFENVGYYVLGIVDGNCDGLVNDLDKAMMIANMREPDPFECRE